MVGCQGFLFKNNKEYKRTNYPTTSKEIKSKLKYQNLILHSSILIRSSIIKKNLYNYNFFYLQDYELWCRLSDKYRLSNLNKILVKINYKDTLNIKKLCYVLKIKIVEFDHTDVVRHPLVSKIIKAYQKKKDD